MSFYSVAHKCLSGFFRVLYRVKITGLENEPTEGPVLVCANHLSNHDVIVLGSALKRPVRFFAKAELFRVPVVAQLVKALGAFPIERGDAASASAALKNTLSLLNTGEMVGIYPQGTRHIGVDPRTTPVKGGVGMVAYHSHATILPVLIRTKKWKMGLFRRTFVTIGKPITFEELNMTGHRGADFLKASQLIFDRITDMIPAEIPDPRQAETSNEN
jgi:1-acyl-sn-glycerol-3-phosphate acyltransferase